MTKSFLPILCAFLLCALPVSAAQETVKIGIAGPFSGRAAGAGEWVKNGATLAQDDINARGGILGKKLEIVFEDDSCEPKQGNLVASRFAQKGVVMAAHLCSTATLPAMDTYRAENIIQMSQGTSASEFTGKGHANVFRTYYSNAQQARAISDFFLKQFSGKKWAIVSAQDSYTADLHREILKGLKERSWPAPLMEGTAAEGQEDFSSLVAKLKKENAEVVFLGLWEKQLGLFLRQASQAHYTPQFVAPDTASLDEVWKIASDGAEGLIFSFATEFAGRPEAKSLVERLKAKGASLNSFTFYTYIMLDIYAQAATQAGSTAADKVETALHSATFKTLAGDMAFDAAGNAKDFPIIFYKWSKGSYKPF